MTPADEAPKPLPCGLKELPRKVVIAYHFQDGRHWPRGELGLAEARRKAAKVAVDTVFGAHVEIYDATTGEWLETWYMDGRVEAADAARELLGE